MTLPVPARSLRSDLIFLVRDAVAADGAARAALFVRDEAVARLAHEAVAADLDAARDEAARALRGTAADRETWGDPRTVARRAAAYGYAWAEDVDLGAIGLPVALSGELRAAYLDALQAAADDENETEGLVRVALEAAGRGIAEGWPPATPVQEAYAFDVRELYIATLRAVREASVDAWKATRADFVVAAEAYRAAIREARADHDAWTRLVAD